MDPIKNPFSPGAGSPPPELVGALAEVLKEEAIDDGCSNQIKRSTVQRRYE
jgi:hypothetical protein